MCCCEKSITAGLIPYFRSEFNKKKETAQKMACTGHSWLYTDTDTDCTVTQVGCNIGLQQEGSDLGLRSFYMQFSCFPCICGFLPGTLTSSHIPKTWLLDLMGFLTRSLVWMCVRMVVYLHVALWWTGNSPGCTWPLVQLLQVNGTCKAAKDW